MLILSELFLTVYFNHFELENGFMTTPKRRSILSFIITCLCITKPFLIITLQYLKRHYVYTVTLNCLSKLVQVNQFTNQQSLAYMNKFKINYGELRDKK